MDAAGTNPPRNYSIVDKSWTCPTTAEKEIINPCREMLQEGTPLGQNRHGLWALGMEQFLNCCKVRCEMAAHWYRVAKGNKLRRICSEDSCCAASDFTHPADGVS